MMKQPNLSAHALAVLLILHSLLLCVFFFLSTANETTSAAAALAAATNVDTPSLEQTTTQTKQAEDQQGNYEKALEFHDEFAKVMGGLDEVQCDDAGDDEEAECMKRRAMSEAHLDYIYTQHHKP